MANKFFLTFILSTFVIFRSFLSVSAMGSDVKANKFGIHIINPTDLAMAAQLVNSNGGDWGWVTIVIQENDRNADKWQAFFDQCRELHLVPLVRLATFPEGNTWSKPKTDQAGSWYNFLNSLNWPTSDRYVIVYNEPNHDKEWGGDANPKEYAHLLDRFLTIFSSNNKFHLLNAGMDLAAPNGPTTYEAFRYLTEMNFEVPGIFNRLSGWSSHSYPNHAYLGKPNEYKKTSIRGYQFELSFLENELGLKQDLPVFITETGWPYEEEKCTIKRSKTKKTIRVCTNKYYSPEVAATYIKNAYENYWLTDNRVKAVTPFILNYPYEPFFEFSWLNQEGSPSSVFKAVVDLRKPKWQPAQEHKYEINIVNPPSFLPANNQYTGMVMVKNIGESILYEDKKPEFIQATSSANLDLSDLIINKTLKPGELAYFDFHLVSSSTSGVFEYGWSNYEVKIKILPDSIISSVRYNLWQRIVFWVVKLIPLKL